MAQRVTKLVPWLLVIIFLAAQCILAWALYQGSASLLEFFGWLIGAIIPGFAFLYDQLQRRSLPVFLFVNRIRHRFNTNVLSWNLSANFRKSGLEPDVLLHIQRAITRATEASQSVKVKHTTAYSMILEIEDGPNIDVEYDPGTTHTESEDVYESAPYIQVFINNYRVGFGHAEHVIKHEILPVLEVISREIQEDESRYTFNIRFDKNQNPYFGLYVAQLPTELISLFAIKLNIASHGQRNTVSVSENSVAINTKNQRALQDLALEFLTFDPNLQEHLKRA